jgi:hypothetical protein
MPKKQRSVPSWLILAALLVLFLAARLPALGRFVTTDEALWLRRSANFYLAVSEGDWASTFQSEHPGLITQWAGAAGFWLRFPAYAQAGEPEVHDSELLRIMENRGVGAMQVLAAGRSVLVLLHAAAFAALWPFASRRLGQTAAAMGMALLALDPFVAAHQRLLHLDGLLASFMLLAVLAWWDYLLAPRRSALAVSAVATGLALLTKTPALFLFPFVLALTLYQVWADGRKRDWLVRLRPLVAWVAIALGVMLLGFPAMWQAPLATLQQMLGYALGSAQGEFSGPLFFLGRVYPDGDFGAAGLLFYALSFLWRSTPLVLIGLGCAVFVKEKQKREAGTDEQQTILVLLAFAISFLTFMTLADKKFDRYLLPALPALILVAGWGWAKLAQAPALRKPTWRAPALLTAVLALQLASAASAFPYYLSYYNPLLRAVAPVESQMQIGWGEGLDQAAAYLNEHAKPSERVASWYSTAFNLMYPSGAEDIPIALNLGEAQLANLLSVDYLVIYVHEWQRTTPQNLLNALAELQPEKTIRIDGIDYVRIYNLSR